jgi:[acyl-carrier-protein] S-malonyltransferase
MNEHRRIAFAFPGMGIRLTGFEQAFFSRHREKMLPFFEEANAAAEGVVDLVTVLESNDAQDLDDRNSQIFTFAFSAAMYEVLSDRFETAKFLAGYSFGHYAALFASRALTFSQGLLCACRAYDIMSESCRNGKWGMAAIVGMTSDELKNLAGKTATLVNINSSTCAIYSGSVDEMQSLCKDAMRAGAIKAELLPVRIPYHQPSILSSASVKVRDFVETLSWKRPAIPIISSIDQTLLSDETSLMDYTARHLCTPIDWLKTAARLSALGVTRIIECGPGVSLSRHGSFMPFEISYVNIKNIQRRCGI